MVLLEYWRWVEIHSGNIFNRDVRCTALAGGDPLFLSFLS